MTKNLRERSARIDADKQAIRDALALAELRRSRGVTQTDVAGLLDRSQANVSRIERERDWYLSTLRSYVAALGGELKLVAVFGGDEIRIRLGDPEPEPEHA